MNGARGAIGPKLETLALAALALCAVLYALVSLTLPFGWDHGIIASVGSSYVDGGPPYVDSWDMKGPAAYLPFALGEALFGRTMWGVRIVDLAISLGAGIVLGRGTAALTTNRIGLATALVCFLWIASAGWFFGAAPEPWVTASLVVAIVPLLGPGRTSGIAKFALSGVLIGFAGMVKPFYFGFGLAPLIALALARDLTIPGRIRLAIALAAGATVAPLLIGGYFWMRGGLAAAIEVHVLYPMSAYVTAPDLLTVAHGIWAFVREPAVFVTAPFALFGIWSWRSRPRIAGTLVAWIAVTLLCVAAQAKLYIYHWFPLYPPLFMLAAMGGHALLVLRAPSRPVRAAILAAIALVLVWVAIKPVGDIAHFARSRIAGDDAQSYYEPFDFRLYNAADEIAAARYIAAHSDPGDGLFVWGSDATAAYLADRPNPTRFTFAMPLTMPGDYRAAYQAEAMEALRKSPPTYFVAGIAWDGLSKVNVDGAEFPDLSAFLRRNYRLETTIGVLDIYRLREQADANGAAR